HNLSRARQDAPHGTNDLIVLEAMRIFKAEGSEVLSLGLSPFAELKDEDYANSRVASALFRFMFEHCQFVYPFKGNYFHKQKYRGRSFQTYVSAMPAINIYRILGIFKAFQIL
ncbi:MAG: phosphatidylglycerol lysyltransferase domain-containing protein, partial [Leptospirales bacterium]